MSISKGFVGAAWVMLSLGAMAAQVQGAAPAPTAPSAQAKALPGSAPAIPVERGGTIRQSDLKAKRIVVDGVPYLLLPTTKISSGRPNVALSGQGLQPGTKIRFTTVNSAKSGADEVTQIWVDEEPQAAKR